MASRAINLLKDGEDYRQPLVTRDQFEFLGYHHDPQKLLYTEDYTQLKLNPTSESKPNFIWDDNHLSKSSAFPSKEFQVEKQTFVLHRAQCKGVKVHFVFIFLILT